MFLYPGTLNHHQGVDIAVDAFASVCDRMPGAEFRIYGDGPGRDSLRRRAGALGVSDRVSIRDFVPFQEMPALLAAADVGVVPKRADGFGNEAFSTKILEFMACGVPVVVSRTRIDAHYFSDQTVRFFTTWRRGRPGWPDCSGPSSIRPTFAGWRTPAGGMPFEFSWQKHAPEYLAIVDGLAHVSPAWTSPAIDASRNDRATR